jgi:hypothetical protein
MQHHSKGGEKDENELAFLGRWISIINRLGRRRMWRKKRGGYGVSGTVSATF